MQNNATDKLSPLKKLTAEQEALVNQIINFTNQHLNNNFPATFTIYGDAGTGKSVVLSALFDQIQKLRQTKNSNFYQTNNYFFCLLYTSDAADDSLRVDLGGRRIIKKNEAHLQSGD